MSQQDPGRPSAPPERTTGGAPPPPPSYANTPNAERYVLEADAMRRRQLRSALLHGSSRTWREQRRVWPAVAVGVVVTALVFAGTAIKDAVDKDRAEKAASARKAAAEKKADKKKAEEQEREREQQEQEQQPTPSITSPTPTTSPGEGNQSVEPSSATPSP